MDNKLIFPTLVYTLTNFKNESFIESFKIVNKNQELVTNIKEAMKWDDNKYNEVTNNVFNIINKTKDNYIKEYIYNEYMCKI